MSGFRGIQIVQIVERCHFNAQEVLLAVCTCPGLILAVVHSFQLKLRSNYKVLGLWKTEDVGSNAALDIHICPCSSVLSACICVVL
jgi:hypothetical protein